MGYDNFDAVVIYGWCPDFEVYLHDVKNLYEYSGAVTKGTACEFFYGIPVTLGEDGKPIISGDVKVKVQAEYRRVFPNASTEEVESECSVFCVVEGDYEVDDVCKVYSVAEFQEKTTHN